MVSSTLLPRFQHAPGPTPTHRMPHRPRQTPVAHFRLSPAALLDVLARPQQAAATALLDVLARPQQAPAPSEDEGPSLDALLAKAEAETFHGPAGQLYGRAGRRATLEDAQRMLDIYIEARPKDLRARVVLLQNLMRQGLGAEREVPYLALRALSESDVTNCDISSGQYVQVLQIVLLGLKACYKLEADAGITPSDPRLPPLTRCSFMAAAQRAVPGMTADLRHLEQRLQRQLSPCSPLARRRLLAQRSGWMSAVDLQAVSGQHHALSQQEAESELQHNPREPEQSGL